MPGHRLLIVELSLGLLLGTAGPALCKCTLENTTGTRFMMQGGSAPEQPVEPHGKVSIVHGPISLKAEGSQAEVSGSCDPNEVVQIIVSSSGFQIVPKTGTIPRKKPPDKKV